MSGGFKTKKGIPIPVVSIPAEDERHWQTCPVCFGKGLVARGFYNASDMVAWPATGAQAEKCRSCDGRGIIR